MDTEEIKDEPIFNFKRVGNVAVGVSLTKRELFAAMAMQGLAAGLDWIPGTLINPDEMADDAMAMAEALLTRLRSAD